MYFYICYKYIIVVVISLNLLSSYRGADDFFMKTFKGNCIRKKVYQFELARGCLTVPHNANLNPECTLPVTTNQPVASVTWA